MSPVLKSFASIKFLRFDNFSFVLPNCEVRENKFTLHGYGKVMLYLGYLAYVKHCGMNVRFLWLHILTAETVSRGINEDILVSSLKSRETGTVTSLFFLSEARKPRLSLVRPFISDFPVFRVVDDA